MKFWIDTEFIERGPEYPIQLISIGIVAEDGREFYAISSEFDPTTASEWVKENVLKKLEPPEVIVPLPLWRIAEGILHFIYPTHGHLVKRERAEFWGYYSSYDWVCFCQIFGTMMNLPKGFPMWCMDLKQWCVAMGDPKLPEQASAEHNALIDARWNKTAWEFLNAR